MEESGEQRKIKPVLVVYAVIITIVNVVYFILATQNGWLANLYNQDIALFNNGAVKAMTSTIQVANLGMAILMFNSLMYRSPMMLAAMFQFGFIYMTGYILIISNIFGVGTLPLNIILWVLFGLPQLLAAIKVHADMWK